MNPKLKLKMITDLAMTVAMLALMAYDLIGEAAHEWIGIGIFILFVLHHILNWGWVKALTKGRYTAYRMLQTILVLLVFLSMIGCMVSGIILSQEVFVFLGITIGISWARILHVLCPYWGFAFLSMHLGLHWNMMLGIWKRYQPAVFALLGGWLLRICGWFVAGYGIYALFKRHLHLYMTLQSVFVFFNYSEPLIFFFLDYLAIMGAFVLIGFYLSKLLKSK